MATEKYAKDWNRRKQLQSGLTRTLTSWLGTQTAALDDIGVAEAMGTFVRQWSSIQAWKRRFTHWLDKERLSPRLTVTSTHQQEALKHDEVCASQRVDVLLERRDTQVVLIVEDDGGGFNLNEKAGGENPKGMGLVGMRERAALVGGTLQIESKPKKGTTIFVRVPVQFSEEEAENAK